MQMQDSTHKDTDTQGMYLSSSQGMKKTKKEDQQHNYKMIGLSHVKALVQMDNQLVFKLCRISVFKLSYTCTYSSIKTIPNFSLKVFRSAWS